MRRSFRFVFGATILLISGNSAFAQSELEDEISKPVEQCIRENAPTVETAVDSLTDGVTFIIDDLCGEIISQEQLRQQKAKLEAEREAAQQSCLASQAKLRSKIKLDCSTNSTPGFNSDSVEEIVVTAYVKPPAPRALAAKLLLDLRLARLKATPAQGSH
jgi:hypothetical protein